MNNYNLKYKRIKNFLINFKMRETEKTSVNTVHKIRQYFRILT